MQEYRLKSIGFWLAASLLFALADFIFSWNPLAAAPYIAHRHEAVFRRIPLLGLGFSAELVNGAISLFAFGVIRPALTGTLLRQGALFGLILWGFWIVSGTMSAFIWLDLPASVAAMNIAFGLPKSLFIGCGLAWLQERRDISAPGRREAREGSRGLPT